jgi:hypothetical protein
MSRYMKRFLKPFLILLSLGIWSVSYGQVEKIRQALEDDNPKRALKLVENGMEDGTLKKCLKLISCKRMLTSN